ncbi:UDP-glucose dehydrogenase family protein [Paenibacillus pinistramenti]|uniref:UDP-glucose dehydrogenase family protein n=1 Tax=Paenibacillus pinistramenti TaxID=1768003 RepID=UPI001108FB3D|nr:UDP-glucose/GDP-mannose dehydrogenase family protein [Paenibacillus pinistramenti]
MKLAVIGTGYVGLTSGVCFAEMGNEVICVDIDSSKIEQLNLGIMPIYEPGIEKLVIKNSASGRLKFTTDLDMAVQAAEIIIIAVGTPSLEDGNVDLSFVHTAAKQIGACMNEYKVIVNKSTVPVGTASQVQEIIGANITDENIGFDVASVPEFLKEGTAVEDFFQTERVVIGVASAKAREILVELHKPLNTKIQVTDIRSAELIKYAANSFLAMKISFINEIANIAELAGADISQIAEGIGTDSRIGSKFLKAGIGFGGACFPKDTKGLIKIAEHLGLNFNLLQEVINVNEIQYKKLISMLEEECEDLENKTVAVLGLSFKPNTDDIREAASIKIINDLKKKYPGLHLKVFDPAAMELAKTQLGATVQYCTSVEDALTESHAALIATEWNEFISFGLENYKKYLKEPIIIDGRNCFSPQAAFNLNIVYRSIGRRSNVNRVLIH